MPTQKPDDGAVDVDPPHQPPRRLRVGQDIREDGEPF